MTFIYIQVVITSVEGTLLPLHDVPILVANVFGICSVDCVPATEDVHERNVKV